MNRACVLIAAGLFCIALSKAGEHLPRCIVDIDNDQFYAPGNPPSPPPKDLQPDEQWIPANSGLGPTPWTLRGFILGDGRICLNTWDAEHKVIVGLRCK